MATQLAQSGYLRKKLQTPSLCAIGRKSEKCAQCRQPERAQRETRSVEKRWVLVSSVEGGGASVEGGGASVERGSASVEGGGASVDRGS